MKLMKLLNIFSQEQKNEIIECISQEQINMKLLNMFSQEQINEVHMKGAIERVMQQCSTYQTFDKEKNNLVNLPLDSNVRRKMILESQYMGSSGLRGLSQ